MTPGPESKSLPDLAGRPALRRSVLLLLFLVVGLCYVLPLVFFSLQGNEGPTFIRFDEPTYAARLERVTQGWWLVGDPWTWEHRNNPSLIPSLPELTLAPLSRLGISIDGIVLLARFLLAGLGALALALALRACGFGTWFAVFCAAWVFTDPGLLYFKPLVHLLIGQRGLPLNRFSNPLFGLLLFFLAWGLGARAFLRAEDYRRNAILSGLLLGLTFYVSIYYWSHLTLALVLTALVLPSAHRWRVLAWGAGVAVVISIPYWGLVLRLQADPVYPNLAWRNGLFVAERHLFLLGHKGMWASLLAAALLARGARPRERALLAGALSGMALYLSPLVIGHSFQNFHWSYTTQPLMYVVAFALLARWAERRDLRQRRAFAIAATAALALSLSTAVVSSWRQARAMGDERREGLGVVDQGYRGAWGWLAQNAAPQSVVLAAETTQRVVPARTGLRVFCDMETELVSFEELLERNQVLWTLSGVTPEAVERELTPTEGKAILLWRVGMPSEEVAALVAQGRPRFDRELCTRLARVVADAQRRLRPADVVELGRGFRLDYLVRGPNEASWGSEPERWLQLEPVWQDGQVRIDRVRGWNTR